MDAVRVLELVGRLTGSGIPVWLEGGWGVDALLRRQTRPHDDLDLVARLEDAGRIESTLGELDYVLAGGGAPASFELVDPEGRQVDVHPVAFTDSGDGVYRMASGEDWIYPGRGFAGRGAILGRAVPCLTPEIALLCHATGYELDAAHRQDVAALAERFGLPLPAAVRA